MLLLFGKVLLEMLAAFFVDRHAMLAQLASDAYRQLFAVESWDRKLIVAKLVGFVCQDEQQRSGLANGGDVTARANAVRSSALYTLTAINAVHPKQMQYNGNQLLVSKILDYENGKNHMTPNFRPTSEMQRILDHTDGMSLAQIRLFMDLLCCVAYPSDANAVDDRLTELREHLDMLVRKQVSSTVDATRKQGIVGMVRLVDHMVWRVRSGNDSGQQPDTDSTFRTVEDIPDEQAQLAARYVGEYWQSNNRYTLRP